MNTYRITLKIKLKKLEKITKSEDSHHHYQFNHKNNNNRLSYNTNSLHHIHQSNNLSNSPPTYSDVYSSRLLSNPSPYKVTGTRNGQKRVAILGSGPAGLVSAKYALEHGLRPVVFEKKSGPGGLWSSNTAIWDGMHTNVSKYSVMFGDFPWPKNSSVIPSAADVYNYLLNYIRHFKLEKYFRLNAHVTSVRQLPNKKWEVNWLHNGERRYTEVFDFLVCSTGLHCKPYVPSIDNMHKFRGEILHSAYYKANDERIKDKRVIVVGNSYSGVEIASHLVDHASSVCNVFDRPYLVFPRLLKMRAHDETTGAPLQNTYHIVPIDLLFGRDLTFSQRTPEEDRLAKIDLYSQLCPEQTSKYLSHPDMYYELDNDDPIREAVTDNYYPYVNAGKIVPRQTRIVKFEPHGVRLANGSFEPADVVLFCTGYTLCMDYLDQKTLDILKYDSNKTKMPILLYNYTIHPDLPNLAMVGEINGLFFAGFELQARWAMRLFTGEQSLPPRHIIDAQMRKDAMLAEKAQSNQYPHGIYNELIDKLASEIDALPDFEFIRDVNPYLYDMLWRNGTIPSHFCLQEKPALAISIMKEVDEIIRRKYVFTDEEIFDNSTSLLARKFSEFYTIPLHLFKD